MPARIVHTADVHLDAAFAGLGAGKGPIKRQAIRDTFQKIITDAVEWPADIVIIAGDLFEIEHVSPDTVGFLVAEFRRLKDIPVVIAPGNHDPYIAAGVYALTDWPSNVHVFGRTTEDLLRFPSVGITVSGFAHTSRHMEGRLLDLVGPAREDGLIPVLAVHASRESGGSSIRSGDDIWLAFTDDEISSLGYHYAALGHYHNPDNIEKASRIIGSYPGTPEGLSFSEIGRRHYSRVTLERDRVEVERVGVSHIDYLEISVDCGNFQTRQQFFDALGNLGVNNPGRAIVRVVATGRVVPGFNISAELPEDIRRPFFHLAVDDKTVPGYDWAEIERENTLRAEVARRFGEKIAAAGEADRAMLEQARVWAIEALEGRPIELPPEVFRVD